MWALATRLNPSGAVDVLFVALHAVVVVLVGGVETPEVVCKPHRQRQQDDAANEQTFLGFIPNPTD